MEQCEYCNSQKATTHCNECGRALCSICQVKDDNGKTKCLSCGEIETIPLTDEDAEDESIVTPFERQDEDCG